MILGNSEHGATGHRATLDDLFRRAGVRHPDRIALADPPNRAAVTGGPPRLLTYAEADRAISAFAGRMRELGLATDTLVGLQLPNTVESVIALLGTLRAGLIAAPLPLLWHRREIVAALGAAGAKAIVTAARVGRHAQAGIAMQAAAELFPVRYVCGFGPDLPDGVVPLDDIFETTLGDAGAAPTRQGPPAAHVAAVTFEMTKDGIVPLARNHTELIAGGLAVSLEAGLPEDAVLLSAIPLGSFAGIAVTMLPWLLSGGTLHLHHGFDAQTFAAQSEALTGATVILPGPAVAPLGEAGLIGAPACVIALWRAPERLAAAPDWQSPTPLFDVSCFGESGLVACRRDTAPGALPVETARTKAGTLALRGLMVPTHPFPPGSVLPVDEAGFLDTSLPFSRAGDRLAVTGPAAGVTGVGFYRFGTGDLESQVAAADPAATIVALPDALAGERLAGACADPAALRAVLEERGVSPLISGAFRERGVPAA